MGPIWCKSNNSTNLKRMHEKLNVNKNKYESLFIINHAIDKQVFSPSSSRLGRKGCNKDHKIYKLIIMY